MSALAFSQLPFYFCKGNICSAEWHVLVFCWAVLECTVLALYLVPSFLLIIIVYNTIFTLGDCRISTI